MYKTSAIFLLSFSIAYAALSLYYLRSISTKMYDNICTCSYSIK